MVGMMMMMMMIHAICCLIFAAGSLFRCNYHFSQGIIRKGEETEGNIFVLHVYRFKCFPVSYMQPTACHFVCSVHEESHASAAGHLFLWKARNISH